MESEVGIDIYVVNPGDAVTGTPVVSGMTYTEDQNVVLPVTGNKDMVACFHGTKTQMFRTTVTLNGGAEYLAVLVSPTGLPGSFQAVDFNQSAF